MYATKTPIKLKKCIQCGGEWDEEAAFSRNKITTGSCEVYLTRPRCIGCELTERNDPTPEARAHRKAYATLKHHAEKHRMEINEFAKRYGWDIERMTYDILHSYANTCCYCWENYDSMGHGLRDITLDIVDRDRDPYYRTNTRWCCSTCNSEKATMTPELWARRLNFWRQWHEHVEAIKKNVTHGLPLFAEKALPFAMIVLFCLFL